MRNCSHTNWACRETCATNPAPDEDWCEACAEEPAGPALYDGQMPMCPACLQKWIDAPEPSR